MDDPNADTEWNDILRKHGILPEKPKELTEEDLADIVIEAQQEAESNMLESATLDDIDALLEDEMDDDGILLEYRKKRMDEMCEQARKERFGQVVEIIETEFVREVTEASKEVPVVVLLYKNSVTACGLIGPTLSIIAKRNKATKFLRIVADKCIHGYPDRNCPTLLIYVNGDMRQQLVGPAACVAGGTDEDLENVLRASGAIAPIHGKRDASAPERTRSKIYGFSVNDEEDSDD